MTDEIEEARRAGELSATVKDLTRRVEQLEGLVRWAFLGIMSAVGSLVIQFVGSIAGKLK